MRRPVKTEGMAAGSTTRRSSCAARGTHHHGGAHQVALDIARTLRGVDDDGVEAAQKDQEHRAHVAYAEQRDRERQPGGDGDGPQALHQRDQTAARTEAAPADDEARVDIPIRAAST
jgi:hypothetical protein